MTQSDHPNTNKFHEENREYLSFSGVFFSWLAFTLLWTLSVIFLIWLNILILGINQSDHFILILVFILLLWSQFVPLSIMMSSLPFKPINYSQKALLVSLLHNFFFSVQAQLYFLVQLHFIILVLDILEEERTGPIF